MHPVSTPIMTTANPPLRRCYVLTRGLLQSVTGLHIEQVEAMIAPLYFPTVQQRGQEHGSEGRDVHSLCCGHVVRCWGVRACGVNCEYGCGREDWLEMGMEGKRSGEAVVCGECVDRVDRVYERFARNGEQNTVLVREEE